GWKQQHDPGVYGGAGASLRAGVHGLDVRSSSRSDVEVSECGELSGPDGGSGERARHDGEDTAERDDTAGGAVGGAGPYRGADEPLRPSECGAVYLQTADPAPSGEQSQPGVRG